GRRLTIRREGTTGYLKAGFHAPSATDPHFVPLLILDAILTGAKGVNLWSSFRVPPPQRSARLYRALVERGLASSVSGSLLPTAQPFLYTLSATANAGTPVAEVAAAMLEALDRVRRDAVGRDQPGDSRGLGQRSARRRRHGVAAVARHRSRHGHTLG